jgi:PAS domain S-box-containing protein
MEYRLRRSDGEYRWVLDTGAPRFAPDGTFLGYIGSCVDITERKHAEDRFRLVVEASPNGIVLVTAQGHIVLVNTCIESLFGYGRGELIGQGIELLVPERSRDGHPAHRAGFHAAPAARAMGAGLELFARRKDGTEFPVEIGLSPIQSSEGMLILSVIVDVSARKRAEAEARRLRDELTHLSRVTMLGEMATSLAHELNQPVGAIHSYAEAAELFLQKNPPDLNLLRDILDHIRQDAWRTREVIQRMRSMLRRQPFKMDRIEVKDLVEDLGGFLQSAVISHKSRLRIDVAPALPPVWGDAVQLQQVLVNLIANALDAMIDCPAEDREVLVRAVPSATSGMEMSVTDRGPGFSKETLARLFEPFFTTKKHGMGIGLRICQSIIEAHGGKLTAENNPNRGATVRFTLPASPHEEEKSA